MKNVDGGHLVAKMLKDEGVECVFTLVGGHIMPILFACKEMGIKIIDVRHECDALYAADAYARTSGKPGVAITTAGPGVSNTLTGMAEADQAGSPVIHIGGAADERMRDMELLQDIDTVTALKPFCRFCKRVTQGDRIPDYMAMAFRHALGNNPGPVYIEIPANLLNGRAGGLYDEEKVYFPKNYRTDEAVFADPAAIEEAAKLLAEAKKPVVVIGEQARYNTKYGEYVEKLVNYLKIPVYAVPLSTARGVFGDETKNELFILGEGAIGEADVILELNATNHGNLKFGRAPYFNGDAKIIQVHPDKSKVGFNTRADLGLVASAGACAMQLFQVIEKKYPARSDNEWVDEARKLMQEEHAPFIEGRKSDILPIHPGRLAGEIADYMDKKAPDWHVVCDGGDSAQWMLNIARARYPGQVIRYGNLGTIGTGAGFTLGAWAADNKPVVYFTGDGSFGFYAMEFETMAKQNMPVVCVIANDNAWGMIKMSQTLQIPDYLAQWGIPECLQLPETIAYEKLAEVWGGVGVKVTKIEEIVPAIEKVMASGKPGIVNVTMNGTIFSPATADFAGVSPKKKMDERFAQRY